MPYAKKSHDFYPTAKVWLIGNYRPKVNYDDDAVWRRFYVIPFNEKVKKANKSLRNRLRDDPKIQQAILTWAVKGYVNWLKKGLNPSKEVLLAKSDYKASMSPLSQWIKEECEVKERDKLGTPLWTKTDDLYYAFERWQKEFGDKKLLALLLLDAICPSQVLQIKAKGAHNKGVGLASACSLKRRKLNVRE